MVNRASCPLRLPRRGSALDLALRQRPSSRATPCLRTGDYIVNGDSQGHEVLAQGQLHVPPRVEFESTSRGLSRLDESRVDRRGLCMSPRLRGFSQRYSLCRFRRVRTRGPSRTLSGYERRWCATSSPLFTHVSRNVRPLFTHVCPYLTWNDARSQIWRESFCKFGGERQSQRGGGAVLVDGPVRQATSGRLALPQRLARAGRWLR